MELRELKEKFLGNVITLLKIDIHVYMLFGRVAVSTSFQSSFNSSYVLFFSKILSHFTEMVIWLNSYEKIHFLPAC